MNNYSKEQLENVRAHCEAEIKARRYWAENLTDERQKHLSREAVVFANDVYCTPSDRQIVRMMNHFHKLSHGDEARPDMVRQWEAAMNGQSFEGEFSFFQSNFPENGHDHDFSIKLPGM